MKRDDIRAIVELHIEQGPVLESEQKQIGIVDSIVGIVNYELTIQGARTMQVPPRCLYGTILW